jgi:DNA-binding response OmpR family regulator
LLKPPQTFEPACGWELDLLIRSTVLVVDDERFLVDLIADVLEDEGFAVIRAYDGLQATRAIRRRLPNLVITDIMMPRMDGLSLAHGLRNRKDPIPVILMSAARRELSDLDVPFLPKPFDIEEIVALTQELTGGPFIVPAKSASQAASNQRVRQIPAAD